MRNRIIRIAVIAFWAAMLLATVCCGHRGRAWSEMNRAEAAMDSLPDSALNILDGIDPEILKGDEEKARYALLKSMALDKNYIDTTDFGILQPAIDYYLKHGTPDEKLKTYYYQGRIYQNKQSLDTAMICFIRGRELSGQITDTLVLANLLTAQGVIYNSIYKTDDVIRVNLEAAGLYRAISRTDYEVLGLCKALNASVFDAYKGKSDSIKSLIEERIQKEPELNSIYAPYKLIYDAAFGTKEDVLNYVKSYYGSKDSLEDEDYLDIAVAYSNIGDDLKAKRYLDSISQDSEISFSWRYLAAKPRILRGAGDVEEAMEAYVKFYSYMDSEHQDIFNHDLLFVEERYRIEKSNLLEMQRRDKLNLILFFSCSTLLIVGILVFFLLKARNRKLELKNQNSLLEKEKALIAKDAAEIKIKNQAIVSVNLALKVKELEGEKETLKELLAENENLSKPVENAIRERLNLLNQMVVLHLIDRPSQEETYHDLIDQLIKDKDTFIKTNRLAFQASHPQLIKYLKEHELTEFEINYVCLLAIGLRGKEAGDYINKKRYYHISSDIRKKLGIDEEKQMYIQTFIRKLVKDLDY